MGVLDDAIREHLELKRQHGAAEEEIRRQADEALGPARREVAPAEADDGNGTGEAAPADVEAADSAHGEQHELPEAEGELDDPHAGEPELSGALPGSALRSDAVGDEEALPEDEAALEETALYELPPEEMDPEALQDEPLDEEPLDEEEQAATLHDEPPSGLREEPAAEPHRPAAPDTFDDDERPPAGDTPPRGFEAVEDDDEPFRDEEEAVDENGDVLEDTPDFLQETPEHDRLWFEQKPPRDFDFD